MKKKLPPEDITPETKFIITDFGRHAFNCSICMNALEEDLDTSDDQAFHNALCPTGQQLRDKVLLQDEAADAVEELMNSQGFERGPCDIEPPDDTH